MKKKHLPIRTCVACGSATTKRELIRVVRTPEGRVEVDDTGKKVGRGAYICRRATCWDQVAKGVTRLERALRGRLLPEGRKMLRDFASDLESVSS